MPFLRTPQTGKYNSDCVRSNIYTFFQPRSAQKEPPRLKPFLPKDTFPECGKNYICGEKFCHFLSHFRSRNVIIDRGGQKGGFLLPQKPVPDGCLNEKQNGIPHPPLSDKNRQIKKGTKMKNICSE